MCQHFAVNFVVDILVACSVYFKKISVNYWKILSHLLAHAVYLLEKSKQFCIYIMTFVLLYVRSVMTWK